MAFIAGLSALGVASVICLVLTGLSIRRYRKTPTQDWFLTSIVAALGTVVVMGNTGAVLGMFLAFQHYKIPF